MGWQLSSTTWFRSTRGSQRSISTQRMWHGASQCGDRVQSARRSRAIHYKINDDTMRLSPGTLRDPTVPRLFPPPGFAVLQNAGTVLQTSGFAFGSGNWSNW